VVGCVFRRAFRCGRDAHHRPRVLVHAYFLAVMKRILQSVALALAVILTANPALATMTCAQQICADGCSSPDCCLPMSDAPMQGMSNDAAMPSIGASGQAPSNSALTELSCGSEPCRAVSAHPAPLLATLVKFSVERVASVTRLGVLFSAAVPGRTDVAFGDAVAPARARYVLFQVFRI
jgi:hypothetical protein